MEAYIEEVLGCMHDKEAPTVLAGLVQNILDEDIPDDVKHKLLKPLVPEKVWTEEVDPLLPGRQQEGPEGLDPEEYYSLFVSGAHLRGQDISASVYQEIRDLGGTGALQLRSPSYIKNIKSGKY
ncbi:uncharacterized protein LOC125560936 [Nematostella vectensis]|uniref:uncharacterized protein LOC125560936 n=1 Tax=Nematostella vectensis TaxID=45351 RepID=UPI002077011D|nr:uncharacterized protein LOC125560936 [Nematostella vectensis]